VFSGHLDHIHVDDDMIDCLVSPLVGAVAHFLVVVPSLYDDLSSRVGGWLLFSRGVVTAEQQVDSTKHCGGLKSLLS